MPQDGRAPTKKNAVSFKKPNLKSRVYERLMNMVIDGKYQDNEMLPPEGCCARSSASAGPSSAKRSIPWKPGASCRWCMARA